MDLTNLQKSNWYFEIRKTTEDAFLVGYISQDALSRVGKNTPVDLIVFAKLWCDFKNKVAIPFSSVTKSSARTIDTRDGDIRILEVVTKKVEFLKN